QAVEDRFLRLVVFELPGGVLIDGVVLRGVQALHEQRRGFVNIFGRRVVRQQRTARNEKRKQAESQYLLHQILFISSRHHEWMSKKNISPAAAQQAEVGSRQWPVVSKKRTGQQLS